MSFDFPHTCPKIDKQIGKAESAIREAISEVLEDASPLLGKARHDELVDGYAKALYQELEGCFEAVRDTNVDMRSDAEDQIEGLELQLAEARAEILRLEREGVAS